MYWKEWLYRAFSETTKIFGPFIPKILPPFLTPLLLLSQFGRGSLMSAAGVGRVALCLAEAYALAFFTGFTWKLFGVVPALLHERDSVIESKDREIDALLAPPVAIKLGRFVISKRFNKTILSLDISTGTTPTTLRNFQIEADGGREMRSPFISFPETRGEHPQTGSLRLDAFHATSGHLQFAGQASPELQWVLSFKDHTEKTYQELIPREVYSAEA